MGIRSVLGKPGSVGDVVWFILDPGEPDELPRYTITPAIMIKKAWSVEDAARTQRFLSPNLRWNDAVATEPSRKAKTDATDFVQARRGEDTGRSETPRAAKIVLPVYLIRCISPILVYRFDTREGHRTHLHTTEAFVSIVGSRIYHP